MSAPPPIPPEELRPRALGDPAATVRAVEQRVEWAREALASDEYTKMQKVWMRRYEIDAPALIEFIKQLKWQRDAECAIHGGFDPDQRGPGRCPYCAHNCELPGSINADRDPTPIESAEAAVIQQAERMKVWAEVLESCLPDEEGYDEDTPAVLRNVIASLRHDRHERVGPEAAYSPRWQQHGDLIRTQLQETGRVRLSFLTLLDLTTAMGDLGIDLARVGFSNGYAVVHDSEAAPAESPVAAVCPDCRAGNHRRCCDTIFTSLHCACECAAPENA